MPVSRREFIKIGAAAAIGVGVASAIEIPIFESVISSKNSDVKSLQSPQAFLTLNSDEQMELEAMVETIIPTDSNGPGAKEAGVVFFIDHQLANEYGNNGRMYMKGPFVMPGQTGPITVGSITYSDGVPLYTFTGPAYQYNFLMREFWRNGLLAVETYSNSAYGNNFENLSSSQKVQVLTDLYNNKPSTANFNNIIPFDFFNELMFMTWSGFLMDPVYGGNANMVGWSLTGFTGANEGDNFKEGRDVMKLMLATKPTRYPPHSLSEFQKTIGNM